MKKITVIIITLCLCLSVTSCKIKPSDDEIAHPNVEKTEIDDEIAGATVEQEITEKNTEEQQGEQSFEKEDQIDNSETSTEQQEQAAQNKEQPGVSTDGELHAEVFVDKITITNTVAPYADIFIGEILSAKTITESPEFENVDNGTANFTLYTVKINTVFKSQVVTEGTTIQVIHADAVETKNNKYWVNGYEIGKNYLIGGRAQPYGKKPVILDYSRLTAIVDESGKLIPKSRAATEVFGKISTVNEFFAHKDTVSALAFTDIPLAKGFYDTVKLSADNSKESEAPSVVEIIDYLKEAIKVDSDKELKVPEDSVK